MELPIRIMIVLFVALVVGAMMIAFARQVLLDGSKTAVPMPTDEDEDDVITFPVLKTDHITTLGNTCIEKWKGKALSRERCFVVLAEQSDFVVFDAWDNLEAENPSTTIWFHEDIEDNEKSMVIYFDPTTINNTLEINPT